MFSLGASANNSEGHTDDNPIYLNDLTTRTFDMFLTEYRPRSAYSYDTTELEEFLGFCVKYQCTKTLKFVTSCIQTSMYQFHPSNIVNMAIKYQIREFFKFGFERLLETPMNEITKAHRLLMGNDVFIALVYTKATLDDHRHIVAGEEPPILHHVEDCQDPQACKQDWHAIWWNGMGRFLLDGRNPQPYDRAVDRFKEMQFGRVSAGCKEQMFRVISLGDAFDYADRFVSDTIQRLRSFLIYEP
ncbi:hypothetical protein BU15DRAFT_48745 [Melanogaster broomeanus]|nr:hypothetical protein BU15DRAFT_48745 [Melanogaster broomeanus]